jgi:hypothetical protein
MSSQKVIDESKNEKLVDEICIKNSTSNIVNQIETYDNQESLSNVNSKKLIKKNKLINEYEMKFKNIETFLVDNFKIITSKFSDVYSNIVFVTSHFNNHALYNLKKLKINKVNIINLNKNKHMFDFLSLMILFDFLYFNFNVNILQFLFYKEIFSNLSFYVLKSNVSSIQNVNLVIDSKIFVLIIVPICIDSLEFNICDLKKAFNSNLFLTIELNNKINSNIMCLFLRILFDELNQYDISKINNDVLEFFSFDYQIHDIHFPYVNNLLLINNLCKIKNVINKEHLNIKIYPLTNIQIEMK